MRPVLDQVGAQQEAVLGVEQVGDAPQEAGALMRGEVADRSAEERDHPGATNRDALQVELEVADQATDVDPLVFAGDSLGGVAGDLLRDVDRAVGLETADLPHGVEQDPRLAGRSGAQLDQARGAVRSLADLSRAALEDLALAAGRVVLLELSDLLEELRALLVVEVARRELLEGAGQPRPDVGRHPGEWPSRRKVDLDRDPVRGCVGGSDGGVLGGLLRTRLGFGSVVTTTSATRRIHRGHSECRRRSAGAPRDPSS